MEHHEGRKGKQHLRAAATGDPSLTPQRRKIVRVIEDSLRSRGYPPSMREIGEAVGLASTSSVSYQLSVLEAKGYLSREAGRPRTAVLRVPGQDHSGTRAEVPEERIVDVPLVGRIAAGHPILADEQAGEVIPVPRLLTGEGSLIALQVAGDSMIGAAIADGDWVVVRRQPDADSGDIVAAMLDSDASADCEATVKKLKKADGHAWLLPHNPAYSPIPADSAIIVGKVVTVLRRLLRLSAQGRAGGRIRRTATGRARAAEPHLACRWVTARLERPGASASPQGR
jgi:repressor LexA